MKHFTKEKIFQLKDKYLGKENTGWEEDPETGAIIVYAINAVYLNGIYYSLENGEIIQYPNYVKSLRLHIGKAPLQVPGTGVVVYRKNDQSKIEILLQLRVDCNKYGLPGGGIELGETYQECATNELQQETGLKVEPSEFKLFNVYAGAKHITKYEDSQDIVYHTVVVYMIEYKKCHKTNRTVDKSETKELKWATIPEIQEFLKEQKVFPNNIPILGDIVEFFKNSN